MKPGGAGAGGERDVEDGRAVLGMFVRAVEVTVVVRCHGEVGCYLLQWNEDCAVCGRGVGEEIRQGFAEGVAG